MNAFAVAGLALLAAWVPLLYVPLRSRPIDGVVRLLRRPGADASTSVHEHYRRGLGTALRHNQVATRTRPRPPRSSA